MLRVMVPTRAQCFDIYTYILCVPLITQQLAAGPAWAGQLRFGFVAVLEGHIVYQTPLRHLAPEQCTTEKKFVSKIFAKKSRKILKKMWNFNV
jgi:hypothetical protein